MNSANEAQLIERFSEALRRDPDALPPSGLDAKTADAVRALVQSECPNSLEASQSARIWQRALAQAEAHQTAILHVHDQSPNHAGAAIHILRPNEVVRLESAHRDADDPQFTASVMPGTRPPTARYVWQYLLTLGAAIFITGVVGSLLIQMANSSPNDGYLSASLLTETPTQMPAAACESGVDYMPYGDAHIGAGDYQAAFNDYTCAITLDPNNYDAMLLRGGLAAARGDYDQLGYDYYAFITRNQGVNKTAQATVTRILPTLKTALEARPDDAALYLLRGLVISAIMLDTPTDMVRLAQLAPDNPVGYLFSRNWPYRYAVDDPNLQKAMALAPDNALLDFWLSRGLTAENAAFAKPFFDRAIQANPQHPFAYQARAIANIYLNDMTAAASDFYQHIQHNPGHEQDGGMIEIGPEHSYLLTTAVGDVSRLSFTAQAGRAIGLDITQNDGRFIPALVVLDPAGKVMPVKYKIGGTGGETLSFWGLSIAKSGTYSLLVKSNSDTRIYMSIWQGHTPGS